MIICNDYSFKTSNTLHINNLIKHMFIVENSLDIISLVTIFSSFDIKYHVIGNASKVLFKDMIVTDPVIMINNYFNELYQDDDTFICSSGMLLKDLILNAANSNYGGFEYLYPIPGCIGGILTMNAGDKNCDISQFVLSVLCVNKDGKVILLDNEECKFEYRNSIFKKEKYVILHACFKLFKKEKNDVIKNITNSIKYRIMYQEINKYTCGSLFKNTKEYKAYELIKKSNSQMININGAHMSIKHNNFLINDGNCTSNDIINLINLVKNNVFKLTSIKLELELNIL